MIRCKSGNCYRKQCCIECDAQQSNGHTCDCTTAEDLEYSADDILAKCEYAEEVKN